MSTSTKQHPTLTLTELTACLTIWKGIGSSVSSLTVGEVGVDRVKGSYEANNSENESKKYPA